MLPITAHGLSIYLHPDPWPLIRPAQSFCVLSLFGLCLLGPHFKFFSESKVCVCMTEKRYLLWRCCIH